MLTEERLIRLDRNGWALTRKGEELLQFAACLRRLRSTVGPPPNHFLNYHSQEQRLEYV